MQRGAYDSNQINRILCWLDYNGKRGSLGYGIIRSVFRNNGDNGMNKNYYEPPVYTEKEITERENVSIGKLEKIDIRLGFHGHFNAMEIKFKGECWCSQLFKVDSYFGFAIKFVLKFFFMDKLDDNMTLLSIMDEGFMAKPIESGFSVLGLVNPKTGNGFFFSDFFSTESYLREGR